MKTSDKIGIIVLTKGYDNLQDYQMLIDRNDSIFEKIINVSDQIFETVIFHEGNIVKEHQEYISSKSNMPLIFRNVKECGNKSAFDDSKNLINYELCPPTEISSRFPVGYKHMCHFWAIDLFDYLKEYEYIIRIDEDVIIHEIHPELITTIKENDIKFAVPFIHHLLDDPSVIVGIETLFDDFCKKNDFKPLTKFKNILGPNTNFMFLNLKYFANNTRVQSFLEMIEKSDGIYSNRWGDAVIWGIIIYALMDEPMYVLDMIEYYHGSHGHHVNKKR